MRKKILIIWLLCLGLSSVAQEVPPGIFFGKTPVKARFNDVLDIFGDKMALYDPEDNMLILARDIARKIENELEYPGQIKVNLIRETKAVESAK